MAKRMHDSAIWGKQWFTDLPPEYKSFFFFLKDMCDNVGVWVPNFTLAIAYLGKELDWKYIIDHCNGNIEIMDNGKWWLVDFCSFQYRELKEDSNSKAELSYIKLLKAHGLWDNYINLMGLEGDRRGTMVNPKIKIRIKKKDTDKDTDRENLIKFLSCVFLTQIEYGKLIDEYGEREITQRIQALENYIVNGKGKKYRDHNLVIRNWLNRDSIKKIEQVHHAPIEEDDSPLVTPERMRQARERVEARKLREAENATV